jgi:hypothetical protein
MELTTTRHDTRQSRWSADTAVMVLFFSSTSTSNLVIVQRQKRATLLLLLVSLTLPTLRGGRAWSLEFRVSGESFSLSFFSVYYTPFTDDPTQPNQRITTTSRNLLPSKPSSYPSIWSHIPCSFATLFPPSSLSLPHWILPSMLPIFQAPVVYPSSHHRFSTAC